VLLPCLCLGACCRCPRGGPTCSATCDWWMMMDRSYPGTALLWGTCRWVGRGVGRRRGLRSRGHALEVWLNGRRMPECRGCPCERHGTHSWYCNKGLAL
jgi:hypothetical protein